MVRFLFSPNTWQMLTFLNPLAALIPKSHFHYFFFGAKSLSGSPSGASGARGSVSVGFGRARQLSPFLGGVGGVPRG